MKRVKATPNPVEGGRLPPHSEEAEQGMLGCILLDSKFCIPKVIEAMPVEGSLFYDNRHVAIWEAICEIFDTGMAIDLITLQAKLRSRGQLEAVGGVAFLSGLPDAVPAASHLPYYLEIVREKYLLRQLIAGSTEVIAQAFEEKPAGKLIEQTQLHCLRLNANIQVGAIRAGGDVLPEIYREIEELASNARKITGIPSGYEAFDRLTAGFQPGEVTILAARPSVGKTALALNIAETMMRDGAPVLFVSLEMTARALMMRLVSSMAEVNLRHVTQGASTEEERHRLAQTYSVAKKLPFYIDEKSDQTILQIRSKALQAYTEHGIKFMIIDYLQLAKGRGDRRDGRAQEVSEVSSGIKAIAKDLNIPVLTLAQLSRDVEKDKREPRLSDLRESGQIEADADMVALMHRLSKDDEDDPPPECPVSVHLAKNRTGPTGRFTLLFKRPITRFVARAPAPQPEFPLPKTKGRK